MTYLGALAMGLVVHEGARWRLAPGPAAGLAVSATLIAAVPASVPLVGAGWAVWMVRGRRATPKQSGRGSDHLGQVLFIALTAGMPVAAALQFAAGEMETAEAAEVRLVLRIARRHGLAAALSAAHGPAAPLFAVLARAQLTGSSAARAVASFVDEERKKRRAQAAEVAQRLPIKLTVPLALLILPGFVLLTVGPTVVATVQRLLGPLLS